MKKSIIASLLIACSLFIGGNTDARAEYPYDKPINIIVPFGPGGGVDIAARILADYFQQNYNITINVVNKPGGILMPLVTTLCVVGGYALNNSNFDLAVMAGFGLLGYIMTKARFPLAPLLLAMILSGIIETNFRRALSISNQDFSVFFTRPVCASFLAISLFILFNLLWKEWKKYRAASAA